MNILMKNNPYGESEHDDDVWKEGNGKQVYRWLLYTQKNVNIDVGMTSNISRRF
jgi:hypothetical protein